MRDPAPTGPGTAPRPSRGGRLPVRLDPVVGRQDDLRRLLEAVVAGRLVTLVGPGGVGKTRLALAAADALRERFGDAVFWVDLAPITAGDLAAHAVADVDGVRETSRPALADAIAAHLSDHPTLLVVDNCEHHVAALAALAHDLLLWCPALHLVATSREALGVAGDRRWPVPPLSLPAGHGDLTGERLRTGEAAQLFPERARAVHPGFRITDANCGAVWRVCHSLDGLPLAIELAAARLRTHAVSQVAAGLDDALRPLVGGARTAPPRHQTLRATLGWSHALLSGSGRVAFRRLAVFSGSFVLEAAGHVVGLGGPAAPDTLEMLTQLVDKSLVLAEASDQQTRFRMLATVRQYATQRLEEAEELDPAGAALLDWMVAMAEELEPQLTGSGQAPALARLDAQVNTLRTALEVARRRRGYPRRASTLRLGLAILEPTRPLPGGSRGPRLGGRRRRGGAGTGAGEGAVGRRHARPHGMRLRRRRPVAGGEPAPVSGGGQSSRHGAAAAEAGKRLPGAGTLRSGGGRPRREPRPLQRPRRRLGGGQRLASGTVTPAPPRGELDPARLTEEGPLELGPQPPQREPRPLGGGTSRLAWRHDAPGLAVRGRADWSRPAGIATAAATIPARRCDTLRSVEPRYTVKPLDKTTWKAFATLVESNNGIFGGCWCMGFHSDRGTTAVANCERKLERVRAGAAHAALVFDGDDCVGWCQFGTPDEVPRIKNRAAYVQGHTRSPDWRIACCYVGKGHRRQGVATAALAGALDLIAALGGGSVEGYPEDAGSVPAGFLYNGALSTYEKLGFAPERSIGKHRWVVTRLVEWSPRASPGRTGRLRSTVGAS